MSADNYVYVRRTLDGRWSFSDESASADYPTPIKELTISRRYTTKLEAIEAAQDYVSENIVEYGIRIEPETKPEQSSCPTCEHEFTPRYDIP